MTNTEIKVVVVIVIVIVVVAVAVVAVVVVFAGAVTFLVFVSLLWLFCCADALLLGVVVQFSLKIIYCQFCCTLVHLKIMTCLNWKYNFKADWIKLLHLATKSTK